MGSNCQKCIAENLREELWSYFALSGLLFLNVGMVLVVYALKRATSHNTIAQVFGIGLIILGVMATLASWYVHRQHRKRKSICSCAFCCWRKPYGIDVTSENKDYRIRLPWRGAVRDQTSSIETGIRMFSTIEFQTYAEYVKRDTVGVQENETRKNNGGFKVESQRYKKQVHPQRPADVRQDSMFVNARYAQTRTVIPQLITATSPSFLQPSAAVSPITLQAISVSPALLQSATAVRPVVLEATSVSSDLLQPSTAVSPVLIQTTSVNPDLL